MPIINAIVYILLFIFAVSAFTFAAVTRNKLKNIKNDLEDIRVQKDILMVKLSETLQALETRPVEQTDGFLRFISESRDSAFEFIEVMQKSIKDFGDETKDILAKPRLSEDLKTIKKAYQVLKENTLPSDIPNN